MIVGEQKPFDEIYQMIGEARRIVLLGCGECVTVCSAGGEKEVALLAAKVRMKAQLEQRMIEVIETTVKRQCDREYLEPVVATARSADVVISMACGSGVQHCAEVMLPVRVKPALNTKFMGVVVAAGHWAERCMGCGSCRLERYAGICPVTRCSKGLLNGSCGGSMAGKCEVDSAIECGWQLILDRMIALDCLAVLYEFVPATDWSQSREGGPRRVIREDLSR